MYMFVHVHVANVHVCRDTEMEVGTLVRDGVPGRKKGTSKGSPTLRHSRVDVVKGGKVRQFKEEEVVVPTFGIVRGMIRLPVVDGRRIQESQRLPKRLTTGVWSMG